MTKLSHPKSGYNQLWRTIAYESAQTLRAIFVNPRIHTGQGYRSKNESVRGCAKCGMQKERSDYSKNQWRKDPDTSKCSACIEQGNSNVHVEDIEVSSSVPNDSSQLPILFLGVPSWYFDTCREKMNTQPLEVITDDMVLEEPSKAKISNVSQKYKGVIATDDWFDVDYEYQPIANAIFQVLKDMYKGGGSVVIATTMGVFSVPQQISKMFQFSPSWTLAAYTKRTIITTSKGKGILKEAVAARPIYTKAHFVQAPKEECLFEEHINPEDYDSDYSDEPPQPSQESPVVMHCGGPNKGRISYFGFVNDLDVSWGDIILKLLTKEEVKTTNKRNSDHKEQDDEIFHDCQECEINYDYIQCDADGCSRSGAFICCPTCKMSFYCSIRCKDHHRSSHTPECRLAVTIYTQVAAGQQHKPSKAELHGSALAAHLAGRRDFAGLLKQAQYWQYENNWEGALETYKSVFEEVINRSPPEQREVYMGISRCFYELGMYDQAIMIGSSAITMNRHYQEVHKYVALSYKAKGDHIKAVTTMTQAVLYESPWDEENIAANKALLKEIQLG